MNVLARIGFMAKGGWVFVQGETVFQRVSTDRSCHCSIGAGQRVLLEHRRRG